MFCLFNEKIHNISNKFHISEIIFSYIFLNFLFYFSTISQLNLTELEINFANSFVDIHIVVSIDHIMMLYGNEYIYSFSLSLEYIRKTLVFDSIGITKRKFKRKVLYYLILIFAANESGLGFFVSE